MRDQRRFDKSHRTHAELEDDDAQELRESLALRDARRLAVDLGLLVVDLVGERGRRFGLLENVVGPVLVRGVVLVQLARRAMELAGIEGDAEAF